MRRVYLDNNATTPLLPEVLEAMRPYFGEQFGNASSIHHHGQDARCAVERAREAVATLLGCRASEIVFTSGGTEATISRYLGRCGLGRSRHHLDHRTSRGAERLQASRGQGSGSYPRFPRSRRGLVDPADVKRALRPNTKLVSIMLANNETGVVQPVAGDWQDCRRGRDGTFIPTRCRRPARFLSTVNRIGCDLLTISGHKMHGPQGTGALYVRKGTQLEPMLYGGSHERPAARRDRKCSRRSWDWVKLLSWHVPPDRACATTSEWPT